MAVHLFTFYFSVLEVEIRIYMDLKMVNVDVFRGELEQLLRETLQ